MSSGGGLGPLPFRLNDFLSGSYYAITIIVVLLGLVSFALSLKWRIDELERREQEHPTKRNWRPLPSRSKTGLRTWKTASRSWTFTARGPWPTGLH